MIINESIPGIPDEHKEFCKKVAELANQYDIASLNLSYLPGFSSEFRQTIEMHWESGRHGASSKRFSIKSTVDVFCQIAD